MPPRKSTARNGKGKSAATRRSARQHGSAKEDDVPDVYKDLLTEAFLENPDQFEQSSRPSKRRKVGNDEELDVRRNSSRSTIAQPEQSHVNQTKTTRSAQVLQSLSGTKADNSTELPVKQQDQERTYHESDKPITLTRIQPQTIVADDYDDSDDSDPEFEDVEINQDVSEVPDKPRDDLRPLQLDLSAPQPGQSRSTPKRRPPTKTEREIRLDVHKTHVMMLIVAVAFRNEWSNDEQTQKVLKQLISKSLISGLHHDGKPTEQKWHFDKSITEISKMWKDSWTITAPGQKRAFWKTDENAESSLEDLEDPLDLEDFRNAAQILSGSRDVGAQLFCSLLRSLAVETRLVCSLQVLPFSGEVAKKAQNDDIDMILAVQQDFGTKRMRRKSIKEFQESAYPVWWVEVFVPGLMQWQAIDPLVRSTIDKPNSFEPPASDIQNSLSYVIAFEDDGTAKDVTRRYTKHYNARVRKLRVESTKHGFEWWEKITNHFMKSIPENRDQIEAAALDRRLALEGMPKNVQDFKGHPIYVLERHLRQNQVIEPKIECGKLSVGVGKSQKLESVYRAKDVYTCRSSEGWYRRGKDVRVGEQPLSRITPRRKRAISVHVDDDSEPEEESVALYAEFQTDIYIPPPVSQGTVPRNRYGNLDVYTKSMIPAGGVHVRHPLAIQAAKTLQIDAVEAVTGFKFKGRQGAAVVEGVVVDEHFTAAMITTVSALEDQIEDETIAERSRIMLDVWRKMLKVLKVRKQVEVQYGQQARDETADSDGSTYEEDGGGFFAGDTVGDATDETRAAERLVLASLRDKASVAFPNLLVRQEIQVVRSPHRWKPDRTASIGQVTNGSIYAELESDIDHPFNEEQAGGFVIGDNQVGGFLIDDAEAGGGFVVEDENESGLIADDEGGGFMPEKESRISSHIDQEASPRTSSQNADWSTEYRSEHHVPRSRSSVLQHANTTIIDGRPDSTANQLVVNLAQKDTDRTRAQVANDKHVKLQRHESTESILSEDPDDEMAEPQWLDDAFDDF